MKCFLGPTDPREVGCDECVVTEGGVTSFLIQLHTPLTTFPMTQVTQTLDPRQNKNDAIML